MRPLARGGGTASWRRACRGGRGAAPRQSVRGPRRGAVADAFSARTSKRAWTISPAAPACFGKMANTSTSVQSGGRGAPAATAVGAAKHSVASASASAADARDDHPSPRRSARRGAIVPRAGRRTARTRDEAEAAEAARGRERARRARKTRSRACASSSARSMSRDRDRGVSWDREKGFVGCCERSLGSRTGSSKRSIKRSFASATASAAASAAPWAAQARQQRRSGPAAGARAAQQAAPADPGADAGAAMAQLQQQQQMQQPMMGMHPGAPVVMMMPRRRRVQQPSPGQQELTLAQIAAAAAQKKKATPKPRKSPVASSRSSSRQAGAAPPRVAKQQSSFPARRAAAKPAVAAGSPNRGSAPASVPPQISWTSSARTLELIRAIAAENMLSRRRREGNTSPRRFACGRNTTPRWASSCGSRATPTSTRDELEKKVAMIAGSRIEVPRGRSEPPMSNAELLRIEAFACWVELTKTYYICVRESRNLTLGVVMGSSRRRSLPDTSKSIPPPRARATTPSPSRSWTSPCAGRGRAKVDRGCREGR